MPSYLARTGLAVFAMLLAITLLAERTAQGSALLNGGIEPPALRELARTTLPIDAAPVVVAPVIDPKPVRSDAIVLASWYGPGFYGSRTACGQTYSPELLGVAHLTLPCGTLVTLTYAARSITVAVIDRGPYVVGRTIDLSNATKLALGCTDLCTLRMQLAW